MNNLNCPFVFFTLQNHSERAPENEWLDIVPHPVFSPDGDSFLLLAGIQETGTEHFTHIKHVTITQQRISVISHGRYEVILFHLLFFHFIDYYDTNNTSHTHIQTYIKPFIIHFVYNLNKLLIHT